MKDFSLTLEQVAKINAAHGGANKVLCHGNTVELLNPLGEPEGWCAIRRDLVTGLCSLTDTRAALGY